MAQLTEEQIHAIENYGDDIKTLKDFVTAVRKRPGMYIGHVGYKGLLNMGREIFQNSIDQVLDQSSPADWFSFYYNMNTLEVRVEDNGKGLPPNDIIRILTTNHTSKNFEKKLFDYSSGLNGSGSKIVNALSSTYIVESYKYDGTAVRMEFKDGYPTTKEPVSIPNKSKKQGLSTYFVPDLDIMGDNTVVKWEKFYKLIKLIMSLTPIGSKMDFEAIDLAGVSHKERIVNTEGIITDLIMKTKKPINNPIQIFADDGTHRLELAFCYDAGDDATGPDDKENITSFANFCPTIGGRHEEGSLEGICRWFSSYMNNIYLSNQKAKDKIKVSFSDVKVGLNCMVAAAHLEPVLTGQSKEILSNEDMFDFCKETVMKGLDNWAKANSNELSKLAKFFKEVAELRMKNESNKAKIVNKFKADSTNGLPQKYIRPLGKKNLELLIVEGDSAKVSVVPGRDPQTQGILPIRGKIINAFAHSKAEIFNNLEVQAIMQIMFGTTNYRRDFKPEECRVSKIIFLADGDVDGAHISALLLRLFVLYFPQLIEAGMVYKATPPLYAIKENKKNIYCTEQIDLIKYTQKKFLSDNAFLDAKKNKIDSKTTTRIFLNNIDYIYRLEQLSNTYSVNPYLMEMVMYNYLEHKNKVDLKTIQKAIKAKYRFMDAYEASKTVIIKGTIEKSNFIVCNDKLFADCAYVLNILSSNDSLYYYINGKKYTIYELMKYYESYTPANIARYKGLGEMKANEISESALRPDLDRTLIRYTIDDAKETIEIIREYESNSKKILQEVGTINRFDLLD